MFEEKPRVEGPSFSPPLAWLGMWILNALGFTLLLNSLFSLHLGRLAGWGTPGTPRFSQMVLTIFVMSALMLRDVSKSRAAPRRSLQPPRPQPRQPPLTAWDLSGRVTAGLMVVILLFTATSRQPIAPHWLDLAVSLAGFYGVAALAFWWRETELPSPRSRGTSGPPVMPSARDPFLSHPAHGVLVFRRPRWILSVSALAGLACAVPAFYLAATLARGMMGTRATPTGAVLGLLFYGGLAFLMFTAGYDIETRFALRDRSYRQTPTFWGIRLRGRTGAMDEVAGLRLCQTYSTRNPIRVQVVWRDPSRRVAHLTMSADAEVAQGQIRFLAETLGLAVLPPVFDPDWRTRR